MSDRFDGVRECERPTAVQEGENSLPAPPFPRPVMTGSFDTRFDLRSFGEPIKRLRSIPIRDTGEPLVDLREVDPSLILRPGCLPLLRSTVAQMVVQAQRNLPAGHTLTVGTCLRTPNMQLRIREHLTEKLKSEHPEWTSATLQRMLNRMVAPLDRLAPAPHTTGAAIDVGVNGPDGKPLRFSNDDDWWSCAPTYSTALHDQCRDNRLMLIRAMEDAGLTNYLGEWWHWSFGDQGWALRVGADFAYYGTVEVENADALKVPEPPREEQK